MAFARTSWGLAQVMGFNYSLAGDYSTAVEMALAFHASVDNQIAGFFRFCAARKLIAAARTQNWRAFARVYNGRDNVDKYAPALARAYNGAVEALRRIGI